MTESKLYTQDELDFRVEAANNDGLQVSLTESIEAYYAGVRKGYAWAVEDLEAGELVGPERHLGTEVEW